MDRNPIRGALTHTRWRGPRYSKSKINNREFDIDQPDNAYVVIELGDKEVVARSNGPSTPIRYKIKGDKDEHLADNIYALRSKILNTVPF